MPEPSPDRVKEIFSQALQTPVEERASFIAEMCRDDEALRTQVEDLLRAFDDAGEFMKDPTLGDHGLQSELMRGPTMESLPQESVGEVIDKYKLIHQIGEGGFGVVYMAEQEKPVRRKVALKIIKLGMDTKQVIARFEAERQALAMMDHPNIAKVLDAGATDTGRPYFVMELVKGEPITAYCDRESRSTRDRLDLFIATCHAVQHAHQKGIIHRDIKPSNVLVTLQDGKPVPKVIDFGIAKATAARLTEQTVFTQLGQFVGTPVYMSPEQAEMSGIDIDTRSDVYSLGVLLYELLTGTTPFDATALRRAGLAEIQRIIREEDPPRPSTRISSLAEQRLKASATPVDTATMPTEPHAATDVSGSGTSLEAIMRQRRTDPRTLSRFLRGDLDWIIMKALEKDRTRRYETATGLADDIERYLNNEPVVAGPPSATYRMRKFVRRNRAAVIAGGAIAAMLILGVIGTTGGMVWALREKDRADGERDKAERISDFMGDILQGVGPSVALGRDTTMLKEMVDDAADRIEGGELAESPEAEWYLLNTLSGVYEELALFEPARRLAERSLALSRSDGGEPDLDEAVSLTTLGHALEEQGEYDQAADMYQEALAIRRSLLGENHADVAESLADLGSVSKRRGKYDESEAFYVDALKMRRSLLDEDDPVIAENLQGLAGALRYHERYDEAMDHYQQSLEMYQRIFGEEHPRIAEGMCNIARVLLKQSKLVESEQKFRDALAMNRRLFGDSHVAIANTVNDLADLLYARGRYDEAEASYREALAMRRQLLGARHPHVATTMGNLAMILERRGATDEAVALHRESLAITREQVGDDHHSVAVAINNLADVLTRRGEYEEAEALIRESTALRREIFGDESASIATAQISLGVLLQRQGRYEEAEALYREALAVYRKTLGNEHRFVASALYNICSVLTRQGKLDEAATYCRESLAMRRRLLDEAHPHVLMTLNKLISVSDQGGDFLTAVGLYRELLELRRSTKPPDHPDIVKSMASLARALTRTGETEEAESLCQDVLSHAKADGLALVVATETLADIRIRQGRFTDAEKLLLGNVENVVAMTSNDQRNAAIESLASLYEAWHAAEPHSGYEAKAAEWRATLNELNAMADDITDGDDQ